jgi:hypothetical protein
MLLPPLHAAHPQAQRNERHWPPSKAPLVYMRNGRNTSRGRIIASLLVGLGFGLMIMFFLRPARIDEIASIKADTAGKAAKSNDERDALAGLRTELASANAMIATLTAANSQLTSDLAVAQKTVHREAKVAVKQTTPVSSKPTVEIASRSVSPATVKPNGNILLTVKVKGHPDKVRMQIVGQGSVSYNEIIYLVRVSKSGGNETWRKNVKAPPKQGKYRYYARALLGSKVVKMPGVSDWTFEVASPSGHSTKPGIHTGN